ncbi:MAG: hypothetical protein ACRDPY_13305 [Streptosporangiaceae bacterium]
MTGAQGLVHGGHLVAVAAIAVALAAVAVVVGVVVRERRQARECGDQPGARISRLQGLAVLAVLAAGSPQTSSKPPYVGYGIEAFIGLIIVLAIRRWFRR